MIPRLLIFSLLLLFSCSKKDEGVPQVISVQLRDNKVPNFSWKDASGTTTDFDSFRGRVTLINFWATWCAPCVKEIPDLVELSKELSDKNVKFIGVSVDRGINIAKEVETFAKKHKISYPVVLASEELNNAFGNINAIPTTFLVDEHGTIRQKIVGMRSKEAFFQAILELL